MQFKSKQASRQTGGRANRLTKLFYLQTTGILNQRQGRHTDSQSFIYSKTFQSLKQVQVSTKGKAMKCHGKDCIEQKITQAIDCDSGSKRRNYTGLHLTLQVLTKTSTITATTRGAATTGAGVWLSLLIQALYQRLGLYEYECFVALVGPFQFVWCILDVYVLLVLLYSHLNNVQRLIFLLNKFIKLGA